MTRLNTARERYLIRRRGPQTIRDLRLMRAGARDRFLATELLPEHSALFLSQVVWHHRRIRGLEATISLHVGSA
jgi:hypothetical protein